VGGRGIAKKKKGAVDNVNSRFHWHKPKESERFATLSFLVF
jgi:hypothetical protein